MVPSFPLYTERVEEKENQAQEECVAAAGENEENEYNNDEDMGNKFPMVIASGAPHSRECATQALAVAPAPVPAQVSPRRRRPLSTRPNQNGVPLPSSRRARPRPGPGRARAVPCLGCARSALRGRSDSVCHAAEGRTLRCYRCTNSGHVCKPLYVSSEPTRSVQFR